jgi:flagellar export protein FliJ
MKRYKFSLEPLLFQRQTIEEQVLQEMARARLVLQQLQAELEDAFSRYQKHISTPMQGGVSVVDIQLHNNYTTVLSEKLEACKKSVREQRKVVEDIRARLKKHHIDTKVVETLKEKDQARYTLEARRDETRQLDEFSSIRHNLNNKSEK